MQNDVMTNLFLKNVNYVDHENKVARRSMQFYDYTVQDTVKIYTYEIMKCFMEDSQQI